jgi:hypothetical protein
MLGTRMRHLFCALAVASWFLVPAAGSAVTISGIVLYATDDFGNPNGFNTLARDELQAQLWRTALGGDWHVLGVWSGLPPQSLSVPPLNGPDAMIEIPLAEGETDFTILGQPAGNTRDDTYDRFAINLYFDDVYDHPGISVLFMRNNSPSGSPTTPNRSDRLYSLGLSQVKFTPQSTYDDGIDTVSVTAVSFLPPETFGLDVDLVSAQAIMPSGPNDPNGSDFVGVLKITVEPDVAPDVQPVARPGVQGYGAIPRGIADSGTLHGADVPIGDGMPHMLGQAGQAGMAGDPRAVAPANGGEPGEAGAEEPTAAQTGTPAGTRTPGRTPSPNATTPSVSPSVSVAVSPTPQATGKGTTPTPQSSPGPHGSATAAATTPGPHGSATAAAKTPTPASAPK